MSKLDKLKVDFFIVGVQKCGTTALFNYLSEHDQIYVPDIKEIQFFCRDDQYKNGIKFFNDHFHGYKNEKKIGAAYANFLHNHYAIERLHKYNPDIKIIVCLKNPVDRAYSAYQMAIKNGWESAKNSFDESILLNEKRERSENYLERNNLAYLQNGRYNEHLKEWLKFFSKEQILLVNSENLQRDTKKVLEKVLDFVGVNDDTSSIGLEKRHHVGGAAKIKFLHRFLLGKSLIKKIFSHITSKRIRIKYIKPFIVKLMYFNSTGSGYKPMSLGSRQFLMNYFKDDLDNLEKDWNIEFDRYRKS